MNGRLAPEKPKEGIALFGEFSESMSVAARVFARNHPDVARQGFRIDKSRRIAEKDVGGQRGDWSHARLRHETTALRTPVCFHADLLIEVVDVRGQMVMECLKFRS